LAGALLARQDHVGLEQHPLERDSLLEEGVEDCVENHLGDLLTTLDRVRPIHEDFRLDDRYELLLLAKGSVPRQGMRVCTHASGTRQTVAEMDDRPPVREPGTHAMIFPETIP